MGSIGVEDVGCSLQAGPWPGPLLSMRILGPAEEVEGVVPKGGAGFAYYGQGFGLQETREIQKVGFLAEREENGSRAVFEISTWKQCNPVLGEVVCETGSTVLIFLGCDAGSDYSAASC